MGEPSQFSHYHVLFTVTHVTTQFGKELTTGSYYHFWASLDIFAYKKKETNRNCPGP